MSDPENTDPPIDPSIVNLSEADMVSDELDDAATADAELNNTELNNTELAELSALLADPTIWTESDPGLEDLIVEEIVAEANTAPAPHDQSKTQENVVAISSRSRFVDSIIPFAVGIAAGLLLAVSALAFRTRDDGVQLALVGTDLAPGASAEALIDPGPLGVRITLDVSGLAPSPPGTYYQAWVRKSPEIGISAGTFHLRGGDGEIELWAGVSTEDYPLITVTLQQEGDGTESSGKVVLKGRLD